MKIKKRLIFVAMALASMAPAQTVMAAGEKGEKSVGVTAGYNARNESAVAGLYFQYRVNRLLRLAPDVTYIFRSGDTDGLALNLNFHMPLPVMNDRINFYPLAGINYTSWSMHPKGASPSIVDDDDVTTRVSKFGLNIGGGFDIHATSTLRFFIEGKYTGVKNYSTGTISAGIGYRF